MIKNILNLGDAALYCDFGNEVNKTTNTQVIKYFQSIKKENIEGINNLTPSYNKLIISFDLKKTNYINLKKKIENLNVDIKDSFKNKEIEIPVCSDQNFSLDIKRLEKRLKLSVEKIYENFYNKKFFMQRRYETARYQLDNPATERPVHPSEQGPQPGESLADDPSNLEVTLVDAQGVHLRWQDNSEREAMTIVQRCQGVGCTSFQNHVGVESNQPPETIDGSVREGITYRYRVYAAWPTPEGPMGTGTSNIVEATP